MSVASAPESGVGITLGYKIGSASVYTPTAQLKDDFEFSGFSTTKIPLPLISAGALAKTPGRSDYGDLTGDMFLVNADAGVAEMQTLYASKQIVNWQLQLNDGTSAATGTAYQFIGFVSDIKPGNFSGDDAPTLSFTIAISGIVSSVPAT